MWVLWFQQLHLYYIIGQTPSMTLTPTTSNAGVRRITVITQVLLYSRPSFQFCKLSQLANSDIQINQLALARCIVFSQFFKLLSKMFIVCWALNNIKRGTNDLTHPASCPVHNQQIFNTDILNFMFVICNNKPQEGFEPSLISIIWGPAACQEIDEGWCIKFCEANSCRAITFVVEQNAESIPIKQSTQQT